MNLKTIRKYLTQLIVVVYVLINLFFMRSFWSELLFDRTTIGARYGEVFVAEWAMDKVYENIVSGKNPFAKTNAVLYPFGIDFSTTDSGNGFFFVLLRPFLSEHQSLSAIVALSLLAANFGMYLLLRRLGFDRAVSFFIGLAYGYMTFLMPRMGHLNYTVIYVFPWFFYFVFRASQEKENKNKIISTIGAAIFYALTLFLNLYYFIVLSLMMGLFAVYGFIFERRQFFSLIKSYFRYLLVFGLAVGFLISPWFLVLKETRLFEELPDTVGWGGAIQFSSDLFGFFVPSVYSYFMAPVANWLGTNFQFAANIFEEFSYPGLIIIFSFIYLAFLLFTRRIDRKNFNILKPYFYISLVFLALTLGPFLHVFGKWGFTVDEGIRIVVPLPFVVLHYLPFLSNIRVPGRLIVGFIFLAYIFCAYLLSFVLRRTSVKTRTIVFSIFALILIIDHYFVVASPPSRFIPVKIYQEIKKDKSDTTVMEAPSTVRDGFVYFGSSDALEFIIGQSIYDKPTLGGYMGRIPYFKRAYYQRNPFLGYVGRLMDKDLKINGGLDKADLEQWKVMNRDLSLDAINFLDLKHFILKDDDFYSATLAADLANLGFEKKMNDRNYSLWTRGVSDQEFKSVQVGAINDDMYLGMGWAVRDVGFRWSGKKSSALFKVNKPRALNLNFEAASYYKPQKFSVYVNRQKVADLDLGVDLKKFTLPLEKEKVVSGINFVYFMFEETYQPKSIIMGSLDDRNLAAKFTKISLDDK